MDNKLPPLKITQITPSNDNTILQSIDFEAENVSTCSVNSKASITESVFTRITRSLRKKKKESSKKEMSTECPNSAGATSKGSSSKAWTRSKIPISIFRIRSGNQVEKESDEVSLRPKTAHKQQNEKFQSKLAETQTKNTSIEVIKPIKDEYLRNLDSINETIDTELVPSQREEELDPSLALAFAHDCNPFNINYRCFYPDMPTNLNEALKDVIQLSLALAESETHLTQIISKYIDDHNFEKELLNILTNHAKLHLKTERRTQTLTQEVWLQQSEIMKSQELMLHENLDSLVKQNRRLQEEIDILMKKNEKLHIIKERQRSAGGALYSDSGTCLIEALNKNNDKLRHKIGNLTIQCEEKENELQRLQKRNRFLEQQLRSCTNQLQSFKGILKRTQTDNQLELAHVTNQLHSHQLTLKDSSEAADVLLEDLDALKRQMKSSSCTLNWTKFKCRGNRLPDLIYMCRSCINELAKELAKSQTETVLKVKDNDTLKEEIKHLEEHLEVSRLDKERLRNQIIALEQQEDDHKHCRRTCNIMEQEIEDYKHRLALAIDELEKERSSFKNTVEGMESLNKKIIEKEEDLALTKDKLSEYKSENDALRMQIHGLKQVLTASGAGDIARELADTQEKMSFFQSQYYKFFSEKNYLMEQLQAANEERSSLNQFQSNYYQFLQVQQQDLDGLNKDNLLLRQELENEKILVASLKNDKAKLKDEKTVMKQIYQQLKNEITKAQKLQGEVTGMNIEASRLAIIAEYNKQLGEKLQCEVADRDIKISELKSNVEKLNNAQLEYAKDKTALCMELSEVCTLNQQLNNSLANQHKKCTELDEHKTKLQNNAVNQLKAMEHMQKIERAALKDLLVDFKNVVLQRDNLLSSQNDHLQQIYDLRAEVAAKIVAVKESEEKNNQVIKEIKNLSEKFTSQEKELERVRVKLNEEHKANLDLRDGLTKVKNQIETLECSKAYLQNNVQKLSVDLNDARKRELDVMHALKQEKDRADLLQGDLNRNITLLSKISQEKESLLLEMKERKMAFEKLFEEHHLYTFNSSKDLQDLQTQLDGIRKNDDVESREVHRLEKIITEKDIELVREQTRTNNLKERLKQLETLEHNMEDQSRLLAESNCTLSKLEAALEMLQIEHEKCPHIISNLRAEKHDLERELLLQLDEMEHAVAYFRSNMDSLSLEHTGRTRKMEEDLYLLSVHFQEMSEKWKSEKHAREKLLEVHKDLAEKLLGAVRMLVNEKLVRQSTEVMVSQLSEENKRIMSDKQSADDTISCISNELEVLKSKMADLGADKVTLEELLVDLKDLYKKSVRKFEKTETLASGRRKNKKPITTVSSKVCTRKESRNKLTSVEERIRKLKEDVEKKYKIIIQLRKEISDLKQQLTVTEFQKCETSLRLHEVENKLKTEQNLIAELKHKHQLIVDEVIKLKREGSITREVSESLLKHVRNQCTPSSP